jgi:hypothetical protein
LPYQSEFGRNPGSRRVTPKEKKKKRKRVTVDTLLLLSHQAQADSRGIASPFTLAHKGPARHQDPTIMASSVLSRAGSRREFSKQAHLSLRRPHQRLQQAPTRRGGLCASRPWRYLPISCRPGHQGPLASNSGPDFACESARHRPSVTPGPLAARTPRFCPPAPIRNTTALFSCRPATPPCFLTSSSSPSSTSTSTFPLALHSRRITLASRTVRPLTLGSDSLDPGKASFSTSRPVMTAQKIDGNAIAKSIRARLHSEIEERKKANPKYIPSLKIIQGTSWPA